MNERVPAEPVLTQGEFEELQEWVAKKLDLTTARLRLLVGKAVKHIEGLVEQEDSEYWGIDDD